jgi:pilus assembly protein CpaF
MFGRRGSTTPGGAPATPPMPAPQPVAAPEPAPVVEKAVAPPAPPPAAEAPEIPTIKPAAPQQASDGKRKKSGEYYETKAQIFNALVEAIDLSQLSRLGPEDARDEIRDVVNDIIALKNVVMSISEQEDLLEDICNDVLGYGPLEPLLARDDIADIMVNGAETVYIETEGKVQQTPITFRDNSSAYEHLSADRESGRSSGR